ncbi:hypothetical protein TPA0907_55520 [Micromonospora humidisoli]|nr:hypothetical protein TPA0907_55520 [Micromonospora sp. AKA109]
MTVRFEVVSPDDPRLAKCGAASPGGRMACEFPPDHLIGGEVANNHLGRDRNGRWRSWPGGPLSPDAQHRAPVNRAPGHRSKGATQQ